MKLSDTVNMMLSEDSKLRLKGELYQAKIRYNDLIQIVHNVEHKLDVPEAYNNTDLESLRQLKRTMYSYIGVLELILIDNGTDTTDWR